MGTREISESAIKRNATWVEAVEKTLADVGDPALTKAVMKAAGRECAQQILRECEQILGRRPVTVDEILEATNARRQYQLHLSGLWERHGDTAHLKIDVCGCSLVKEGLARPNPIHCLCTVGMFEHIFSAVCQGPVNVEVIKTIGSGDDACEFAVYFEE